MNLRNKIKAAIRKNAPECKALVSGRLPSFVYGQAVAKGTVPVFVFHEVASDKFEAQLRYLRENGYTSLDASELQNCLKGQHSDNKKKVVLTFDDGHISMWQQAYPLLKQYNFKAVCFICPGLIPDEEHLDKKHISVQDGKSIKAERTLCDWQEIVQMHESGHVDFQSHSMYHDLVFTSAKLIDFYSPFFSSSYLGKKDVPVILRDDAGFSITNLWPYQTKRSENFFGFPVFEHAPRMMTEKRYYPSKKLVEHMCTFVQENGGHTFFQIREWKKILKQRLKEVKHEEKGCLVSGVKYQEELTKNLFQAKDVLEKRLRGKRVLHFCLPWFAGADQTDHLVARAGYKTLHYGFKKSSSPQIASEMPVRIFRVSEEYLFTLPGRGSVSPWSIWSKRLKGVTPVN